MNSIKTIVKGAKLTKNGCKLDLMEIMQIRKHFLMEIY